MGTGIRNRIRKNSFSLVFHVTSVVMIVAGLLLGGCNSDYVLERSDERSKDSELIAVEEASDTLSISSDQPIYGIITDIGVFEFQAYESTGSADSTLTLGMTRIVVTDSSGNETTVTFMNGLYLLGDSLKGVFTPGIGGTTSYFTETYAPQCRPVIDEVIPNVDGHLISFALTEDLANDLCSRPGVNCVW